MENNISATVQADPVGLEVPKQIEPAVVAPPPPAATPKPETIEPPPARDRTAANPQENAMQTRARKKNEKEKPSTRTKSNPRDAMAASVVQPEVESEPNRVFRLKYAFQQALVKLSSSEVRERVKEFRAIQLSLDVGLEGIEDYDREE
jgi:hypothetical protein